MRNPIDCLYQITTDFHSPQNFQSATQGKLVHNSQLLEYVRSKCVLEHHRQKLTFDKKFTVPLTKNKTCWCTQQNLQAIGLLLMLSQRKLTMLILSCKMLLMVKRALCTMFVINIITIFSKRNVFNCLRKHPQLNKLHFLQRQPSNLV